MNPPTDVTNSSQRRHRSEEIDDRSLNAQKENMKKLFVLIFGLFIHETLQETGTKEAKEQDHLLRTYKGSEETQTTLVDLNGTPNVTVLVSLSNSTKEYLNGPVSTRVIPIIYVMVVTVGVPANIVILCLLVTHIRKDSNAILYSNLAVYDLFLLLTLFFKAHYHFRGNHWVFGEAACRLVTACFYGNLYGSALTLTCIAVKRYMAVVYPFIFKTLPKIRCTIWVVLSVWGVFGVAIVPELLVQQSYWLPQLNRTTCHDVLPLDYNSHHFLLYYYLVLTVLCLLVPLVVTVACFIQIIRELHQSDSNWAVYIRAISLVYSIFMVCFLPAGVLNFIHYVQLFVNGTEDLYMYFNISVCLCCVHACLDPFLFYFMSQSSRSKLYFLIFGGKTLSTIFTEHIRRVFFR